MNRTAIVCTTIATLGALGIAALLALGPLNPPAGAVSSSNRTLQEIYDKIPASGSAEGRIPIAASSTTITINQPGSYVLTGNLIVPSSSSAAVIIAASNVTLDLNGYQVAFNGSGAPAVLINAPVLNVVIRNGSISNGSSAVRVPNSTFVSNLLLEDLRCDNQYLRSIDLGDTTLSCTVRRCSITNLGATYPTFAGNPAFVAISCQGNFTRVEDCTVMRCAWNPVSTLGTFLGIAVANAGEVRNCGVFPGVISGLTTTGYSFGADVIYRDNATRQVNTTGYTGGINAGGNF